MSPVTALWARTIVSHRVFTGVSRKQLGRLVVELSDGWVAARESDRHRRRGGDRRRLPGAGGIYGLVFVDRVLVTLLALRLGLPHEALGHMFGVSRQTVDRAVREIRPLLAKCGFATPLPGPRLRTLADVFAYAQSHGVTLRVDGTEIRVRRPRKGKRGRNRFISGKVKMNTIKTTVIADETGHVLWTGATVPGRMHDQTAVKTAGIDALLEAHPDVGVLVDAAYRGLARDHPGQVTAPPRKPRKDAAVEVLEEYERVRHEQSSARIPVEHANAKLKAWRSVRRWDGRRDVLPEIIAAVSALAAMTAAT
jgi:hypothetical protein